MSKTLFPSPCPLAKGNGNKCCFSKKIHLFLYIFKALNVFLSPLTSLTKGHKDF